MSDKINISEEFKNYTDRMLKIRLLSSPDIQSFDNAETYSERLRNNFKEIGRLAAMNREMLDGVLYPELNSEDVIEDEFAEQMGELAENLISLAGITDDYENLDAPVALLIADRLMKDCENSDDMVELIRRMDEIIPIYYALMNMTERIVTRPEISKVFHDKGLELGERFLTFLDKDVFATLPDDDTKDIVLINARFMTAFFESSHNPEENRRNLEILDMMMDIAEDPFYHEHIQDYDWKYFKFRVLEYFLQCTDVFNARGFTIQQLMHICKRADELEKLCESDPEFFEPINGYKTYPILVMRNRCLAGFVNKEKYKGYLLDIYETRDKKDVGMDGGYMNILIPLEIMRTVNPNDYNAEEAVLLNDIYQSLVAYLFHIPNSGVLAIMLEFAFELFMCFVDVPGGITFEDFVRQCLAAIHPPTYIHSCMVGQISARMAYHLIRKRPELFIGILECNNAEEVISNRDRIVDYVYHAGLCHDFGKICIIDTIFVYGRKLLDFEFDIIKSHPLIGSELLKKHFSTREYADVALGHHRWYNDEGGYPADFNTADSKYKTVIDLVQCADCMDAATDTVGRSYSKGKTLAQFMEELKEGSGTRYAPWLYDLYEDPVVFNDVEYMLNEGRQLNYKETYNLLRDVKERG